VQCSGATAVGTRISRMGHGDAEIHVNSFGSECAATCCRWHPGQGSPNSCA
jgi:hypothetical protein